MNPGTSPPPPSPHPSPRRISGAVVVLIALTLAALIGGGITWLVQGM